MLDFHAGMGQAVAERTILRTINNKLETWEDVCDRVSLGNSLLVKDGEIERETLRKHMVAGTILLSGRHLQHGDELQRTRNMEVFTNCSTAATSFLSYYLLLNGSGVGRSYDDALMLVDWDLAPDIVCVLDQGHKDFNPLTMISTHDAKSMFTEERCMWHKVEDSREGLAKALELWETLAFTGAYADCKLILDFSDVRPSGSPISGMQNRPSSGPVPTMVAFMKAASVKNTGMMEWEQTMWIDHYFAESVLVGGARRSARIATKWWKDPDAIDFVNVKRRGVLWSANNSLVVDEQFWVEAKAGINTNFADVLFKTVCNASYNDGTGEPGLITISNLDTNRSNMDLVNPRNMIGSKKYKITSSDALDYITDIYTALEHIKYPFIVNPCAEIVLLATGGFCVIGDVAPYFASSLDEAEDAIRATVRALIRVNLMDSIYKHEVRRTNRIGVGLTGVHEFAWKFFGLGFYDLLDEEKAKDFWMTLHRFSLAAKDEAKKYSKALGLSEPHTVTTIKPAGTTSKLFGLTEGWHLPSMRKYLRWVQFKEDSNQVDEYIAKGYPHKRLVTRPGTVVIGFPTEPIITTLGMGNKLVTAGEVSMEDQFRWLQLGEKYWIGKTRGNQISYTLKYKPELVSYQQYCAAMMEYMPTIRCCSVMPQVDMTAYEYQPEEPISNEQFNTVVQNIRDHIREDVGLEHVDCGAGGCPIDFN